MRSDDAVETIKRHTEYEQSTAHTGHEEDGRYRFTEHRMIVPHSQSVHFV